MMSADDRPIVSVCVVTYNQQDYIEDCLLSVLAQTPEIELEILVGDDCSTDGTAEIVERISALFPARIVLYRHVANLGASANYQFLISRAKGDYIAHLD